MCSVPVRAGGLVTPKVRCGCTRRNQCRRCPLTLARCTDCGNIAACARSQGTPQSPGEYICRPPQCPRRTHRAAVSCRHWVAMSWCTQPVYRGAARCSPGALLAVATLIRLVAGRTTCASSARAAMTYALPTDATIGLWRDVAAPRPTTAAGAGGCQGPGSSTCHAPHPQGSVGKMGCRANRRNLTASAHITAATTASSAPAGREHIPPAGVAAAVKEAAGRATEPGGRWTRASQPKSARLPPRH
jgi:hypothetical protein